MVSRATKIVWKCGVTLEHGMIRIAMTLDSTFVKKVGMQLLQACAMDRQSWPVTNKLVNFAISNAENECSLIKCYQQD